MSSAQLLQIYAEKEHPFKPKITKHAFKIENSVRTLNNLLTSVLFFGKADADKIEYKPKKMFLGAFVKEVLDTVNAGKENDVKIKSELVNLPKVITSDSDLLYQIIVEGSGLGLSIVKKCIDVLKGEIKFESSTKSGTTFKVEIPVH